MNANYDGTDAPVPDRRRSDLSMVARFTERCRRNRRMPGQRCPRAEGAPTALSLREERKMATAEERLMEWLRDAHAAEEQAETMLSGMTSRIENYPSLKARIRRLSLWRKPGDRQSSSADASSGGAVDLRRPSRTPVPS